MATRPEGQLTIEQEELRGIARTVAEIEWLLLILTLLYQIADDRYVANRDAIAISLLPYGAFILGFHYANFYKRESRWKVAIETWVMIGFITWVVWFSGRLQSPLLNLYLLPVITSALALGKVTTLLETGLITACYVLLRDSSGEVPILSLAYGAELLAGISPLLLVAYVTTMFSADIRYGINKAKLLSETDDLTGLYNMRGFSIVLDRAFGQSVRYSRPLSILMIDSDNLKAVNDTYGHEAGNELLRLISQCVKRELRTTDVVARYGGDEFAALLPDTHNVGAQEVAERIRASIAGTPLQMRGDDVPITVSVGVATYPDHGRSIDTVMQRADSAMYGAKNRGKNQVVSYAAVAEE